MGFCTQTDTRDQPDPQQRRGGTARKGRDRKGGASTGHGRPEALGVRVRRVVRSALERGLRLGATRAWKALFLYLPTLTSTQRFRQIDELIG